MGAAAGVGRVAVGLGGAVLAAAETFLTVPEDGTFLDPGMGKTVLVAPALVIAADLEKTAVVVAALFSTLALV